MKLVHITFETSLTPEELHELLCTAIHEGNLNSLKQLERQIADIQSEEVSDLLKGQK